MKILVCPLNWGLGHATRCVPIIYKLAQANDLIIISDGFPLNFLKNEFTKEKFPRIEFDILPSYSVHYSKKKSQTGAMINSLPKIIFGIIKEHFWLKKYIEQHKIDKIISDNRFGMWNKRAYSIYVTHQLMVKMPPEFQFLEKSVWRLHRWFINHYDECWIPDFEDTINNMSGDLSHKYSLPKNAKFIGMLSRFQILRGIESNDSFSIICVLSGVEPQRTVFETFLLNKFKYSTEKILIIRGQPQKEIKKYVKKNITVVSHLSTEKIASYLLGCKKIICRSGYSSIMDLTAINCLHKVEFFPTPGQTEQEYLAKYLDNKTVCYKQ